MQVKELNLVIPGLFSFEAYAIQNLSQEMVGLKFNKFLAHCTIKSFKCSYSDLTLVNQLHKPESLAIKHAKALGLDIKQGSYLLAEIANCKAQGDKLVLWGLAKEFLSHAQALEYIIGLNANFVGRIEFHYINNNLWLMHSVKELKLDSYNPVIDIIGQDIDAYLPQGEDQLHYSSILNEIQMLLYNLAPSQEARANGFNTLWLWDKKANPALAEFEFNKIATNLDNISIINPSIIGIGNTPCLDEILEYNLVFLNNLYYPAQYSDMYLWQINLQDLDEYLVGIIEEAWHKRNVPIVNFFIPHQDKIINLTIGKNDKYKFWRRTRHKLTNLIKDSNEE